MKAPHGASPGVFSVSFFGKMMNGGKVPFTLGKNAMTIVLGAYDPDKVNSTTPIVVNGPGSEGPIVWGEPRVVDAVGRAEPSDIFPGEENWAEHSFLVAGPSHAFIRVSYAVPISMKGKQVDTWKHSHVVHLLDVVKADDKAWKSK